MASFQKVIVMGHLGRDPEVRYMPNGDAVCNISIATTRTWKKDGEKQEETEWHRVTLYQRQAEIAGEYLKKGSACLVEGRLKTRKWQDKEGRDQYTTEIIAESLQLIGGGDGERSGRRPEPPTEGERRESRAPAPAAGRAPAPAPKPATGFDDMDDDIPF